ncbi:MAG TPA: PLP-dependent aminotransferase family protein [Candidatus Limnocylindrales bacterium]|nr:PLP-dependent aminotransferase family protein [Candidatus Limnocylindrales bacterium]
MSTSSRTASAIELLVPLRRDSDVPLHRQLEQQLRDSVRSGRFAAESTLPSTRALAGQLGIARGVVVEAYEQLIAEGYLASRPGGSTRVARVPIVEQRLPTLSQRPQFEFDFRPGRPDLTEFPRSAWLRSLRRVLNETPATRLGYIDGRGMPELRAALSTYLNRARGTGASASEVVIATGFAQALQLLARTLRLRGARRIGIEDPWHPEYRAMVDEAGLQTVPIAVDDRGISVDALEAANVDAVVVTPAHQYPTGAVLPAERRAALIAWADRRDATIIEDDYDSEFRYDREPIGAMQGLCADRVAYVGTASKVLAPGLRLGWIVAPSRIAADVAHLKMAADHGSAALDQLALADFITRGELDRHLRRMRILYRRRRDVLLDAFERHLPQMQPCGASAGLHVLATLPDGIDESALVERAAHAGIGLVGLSSTRVNPDGPGGLVFGYGSVDERQIKDGVARIAGIVDDLRSSTG